MSDKITIVNRAPGMTRAGVKHPAVQTYAADHFKPGDLLILVREPQFTIVRGTVLTEAEVLAMITHAPSEATAGSAPAEDEGKASAGKKAGKTA